MSVPAHVQVLIPSAHPHARARALDRRCAASTAVPGGDVTTGEGVVKFVEEVAEQCYFVQPRAQELEVMVPNMPKQMDLEMAKRAKVDDEVCVEHTHPHPAHPAPRRRLPACPRDGGYFPLGRAHTELVREGINSDRRKHVNMKHS